jgi:hypothetical protein
VNKVEDRQVVEDPKLANRELTIHEQALAKSKALKPVVKRPPIADPKQ